MPEWMSVLGDRSLEDREVDLAVVIFGVEISYEVEVDVIQRGHPRSFHHSYVG